MRSRSMLGTVLALSMVMGAMALPQVRADDIVKVELKDLSETYYDIEGPIFEENKTMTLDSGPSKTCNVTVDMLESGAEKAVKASVTFPYTKFNWSIGSWYRTSLGLRFYDVKYKTEGILYDYRIPWVKVGGTSYDLTSDMCTDGPDLYVYSTSRAFKVWAEYSIDSIDVVVQVYCYFFEDGEMDPWAVVDCHGASRSIIVPQRFDFDLGGSDDDNVQRYTSHPTGDRWDLVTVEGGYADANQPEDDGIQWQVFDTDRQGMGFVTDQRVDVEPYHSDTPYLTVLRYHSDQMGSDPGTYDNDETTGAYYGGAFDPYSGCDLVEWYVSSYGSEDYCNPGPWMYIDV